MITDKQLENMLHALGSSSNPDRNKMGWRNYYCTGNPEDTASWEDLCGKGLAHRNGGWARESGAYRVSADGLKLLGVTLK